MRKILLAVLLLLTLTGCVEPKPTVEVHCGVPGEGGNVNVLGQQKN